jgi:hypothetical protein
MLNSEEIDNLTGIGIASAAAAGTWASEITDGINDATQVAITAISAVAVIAETAWLLYRRFKKKKDEKA